MPKVVMRRRGLTLVPATKAAEAEVERLPHGERLFIDATQPRNTKFHALYWQMCTFVADALRAGPHTQEWTQEMVSDRLKLATGHADVFALPPSLARRYGITHAIKPASISFAKMDETQFGAFVEAAVAYLLTEFGPWLQDDPNWRHVREITARASGARA